MHARSPLRSALLTLLLAALASIAAMARPAATARLRDITVTIQGDRATIRLLMRGAVATLVTEPKGNDAQLRLRSVAADRAALGSGIVRSGVRSIRAHIERRDVLVVDVDFVRSVEGMTVVRRTSEEIVVAIALGGTAAPGIASRRTTRGRRTWALSTIVIDAGHGGKDPGAIGIGGVREKDVTLAVARQVKRELEKSMRGVKVVLTRSDDRFVELYRRGQIANERDGRLFVSIHCNALPDSVESAHGFECYILRPGKSDEAAGVAATENGAIRFEADRAKYDAMSAENTIVASMAQSAFARYSEQAAQAIRVAMRSGTKLRDRGVHQAGFFVLVGASMPAVLVEMGYLSSSTDIRTLRTTAGRRSLARSIAAGIVRYEKIYSASLD